ncbi:hypothetical protein [Pannonibacter tanglangensis]|uniref:Uncharacterized protein n=1 Tax=Pannonibacter tanglangensis TaxID=2750084 RepID=A0ABW9ZBS2_9HYPH|nr:hypothetical protein [Pannonibacter sp. XCT-34]NBN62088.1 hypothetical protein [Pannonibacter sp. XCT-34]
MKRFSFDWETVGMGAGLAEFINDDGAEQEVRAHAVHVWTWAIRDNHTAQVIAACHDAVSAQAIVDALNGGK